MQHVCPASVVRMVRVEPENKPNLVKPQPSNVSPRLSMFQNVDKVGKNNRQQDELYFTPSEQFSNSDHVLSYFVVGPTGPLKILEIFPSHCIQIEV